MAAAAWRPAPIYLLNRYADMSQLTGEPGEGWFKMECDSKKAYGCGENIQEAVKGLALYVRLGDDPLITSSWAIRMTDEALRRFTKEFQRPESSQIDFRPWHRPESIQPEKTTAWARIQMHAEEEDLMIITLVLDHPDCCSKLFYDLVYDRKRASLSIIKPADVPALALKPVVRRTCNGDYEVLHMAIDLVDVFSPRFNMKRDPFLCVFSPATAAWEMRSVVWPVSVDHKRFRVDLAFSFQGISFWVDLSLGLKYCYLNTAASSHSVVEFSCYPLPHQCVLDLGKVLALERPMEATRTMACDRDSIWFVCIDGNMSSDDCAENLVSMWTLKVQGEWKNEAQFSLRDLWRFDGFKEAGLPEAQVGYPHFNAVDGVLCLMLGGEYSKEKKCWVDHMCSFDVRNKKLLWHGTVHNVALLRPAAIPSGFFQTDPAEGLAAASCSISYHTADPAEGLGATSCSISYHTA